MTCRGSCRQDLSDQRFNGLGTGGAERWMIGDLHGKVSTFHAYHRTVVEEPRHGFGIQGRRHDNDDEVGANIATNLA